MSDTESVGHPDMDSDLDEPVTQDAGPVASTFAPVQPPNDASTSVASPSTALAPETHVHAAASSPVADPEPDPSKPTIPVRHPEMCYDDGNLFVMAENTAFQVHRSVLSRKSALFKDLLSLPQPDTEEKFEGLPVVRILETASDVAMLIDGIYNGEKYRYREDEGPNWPIVRKLLTLGTKYQVEELRSEAIQQLNRRYPKKITGWDETCRIDEADSSDTKVVQYLIEDDLVIANVARSMDLPDIHLAALYGCCSLAFDVLVNGRTLEDGTVERLSTEDLIACLQGKENLLVTARANARMNLFAPDEHPIQCRSIESCTEKTAIMLARYRTAEARPYRKYDPLRPDDEDIEKQCMDIGLCHGCIKFYLERHASLRQEIRSNLGNYICQPVKL